LRRKYESARANDMGQAGVVRLLGTVERATCLPEVENHGPAGESHLKTVEDFKVASSHRLFTYLQ